MTRLHQSNRGVFEDVAFARRYKNKFDLNEALNED